MLDQERNTKDWGLFSLVYKRHDKNLTTILVLLRLQNFTKLIIKKRINETYMKKERFRKLEKTLKEEPQFSDMCPLYCFGFLISLYYIILPCLGLLTNMCGLLSGWCTDACRQWHLLH